MKKIQKKIKKYLLYVFDIIVYVFSKYFLFKNKLE